MIMLTNAQNLKSATDWSCSYLGQHSAINLENMWLLANVTI